MSSSILLEGLVEGEEKCTWQGQWHFFKDQKIPLDFRYTRAGDIVPLQLIQYVSFIPAGSDSLKPRSRGRVKGWRKQQREEKSQLPNAENKGEDEDNYSEVKEKMDNKDLASPELEENDILFSTAAESFTGEEEAPEACPDSVPLPSHHKLFGYYEGSFDIKSNQGPTPVDESFFLHSFAATGSPVVAGLECLPPTDWWTSSQLLKHMSLDANQIFNCAMINKLVPGDKIGAEVNFSTEYKQEQATEVTQLSDEAGSGPGISNAGPNMASPEISPSNEFVEAPVSTPRPIEGGNDEGAESLVASMKADNSAYPDLDFLLGFGKNAYGRFSLFGIYSRKTNTLQCERKYLTGRTAGLKRSIRSGSILGMSREQRGDDSAPEPRMTTRPHRIPSFYLPEEVTLTPRSSGTSQEKRQRSVSTVLSVDESSLSHSSKRRRAQSSGGDLSFGLPLTPSSLPRGRSSSNLESNPAQNSSDRSFNDMNNTTIRYRPVYYDDESNSYYEGWWCGGYRNGRGLCLYSDKLMYEGNWSMGRENGRGVLMTGNRQVLYRGDWVDGCFHGSGTYTFPNGDIYRGDWREGKRHGKGEYFVKAFGCTYFGDWKENKRHGKGIFEWADGSKYDGDWEKDYRSIVMLSYITCHL